jgi:hypothetical protein
MELIYIDEKHAKLILSKEDVIGYGISLEEGLTDATKAGFTRLLADV